MASPRWAAQRVAHPRLSRGPRRPGRRARSGLWARDGVQSRRRRGRPGSNSQTGRGDGHDRHYLLLIVIIVLLGGGVTWAVTQLRSDEVTQWFRRYRHRSGGAAVRARESGDVDRESQSDGRPGDSVTVRLDQAADRAAQRPARGGAAVRARPYRAADA